MSIDVSERGPSQKNCAGYTEHTRQIDLYLHKVAVRTDQLSPQLPLKSAQETVHVY